MFKQTSSRHTLVNHLLLILTVLTISSCSSGGSGGNDVGGNSDNLSISISQPTLEFSAMQNGEPPAMQSVNVSYTGETIGFTILPDESLAWLDHKPNPIGTNENTFPVEVGVYTTNLEPGTYQSTIRYQAGNASRTSLKSADINITYIVEPPTQPTLPSTPANFTASPSQRGNSLSWYVSPLLSFAAETYFKLYYYNDSGTPIQSASHVAVYDDHYYHIDLAENQTVYYRLTFVENGIESNPTGEVGATTLTSVDPPFIPIDVKVFANELSNVIRWYGAFNADGYNLYWSTSNFTDTSNATLIENVTTPYVHSGLTANQTYYYKLTAYNSFGEGSASPILQATPDGSWIRQLSTKYNDFGHSIDVDAQNNLYVIGRTNASFSNNSIEPNSSNTAPTDFNPFITKYTNTGSQQWIKTLDFSVERVYFSDIAVDDIGNSYITGNSNGDFAAPNSGGRDLILVKYDTDAALVWKRQLSLGYSAYGHKIKLDSKNNILVSSLETPTTNDDIVIRKFNNSGDSVIWEKSISSPDNENASDLIIDNFDNIYVAVRTPGDLFGDGDVVAGQNTALYKYNANGDLIWSKLVHAPELNVSFSSLSTDGTDYLYITCVVTDTNLAGDPISGSLIYLLKFDLNGNNIWEKTIDFYNLYASAVDNLGNIHIVGTQRETPAYNTLDNIIWKKYDSSGNEVATRTYTTDRFDQAYDLVLDSDNRPYLTGRTDGDLEGIDKVLEIGDMDFVLIGVGTP